MERRLKIIKILACTLAGLIWMSGCKGQTGAWHWGYRKESRETKSPGELQPQPQEQTREYDRGGCVEERENRDGFQVEGKGKTGLGFGGILNSRRVFVETGTGIYKAVPAKNGLVEVLVSKEFLEEVLEIGVLEYEDSQILLQQGDIKVKLEKGSRGMTKNFKSHTLGCEPFSEEEILYLPLEAVCEGFGYRAKPEPGTGRIGLEAIDPYKNRKLPKAYDYRKVGRSVKVRDQGGYGTCWSFASLTALETALRPQVSREFSADHMSLHNSFSLNQRDGGEYTMSMAYLLAWQGPVSEALDPYGDGVSPDGLEPEVHVQEIQILPAKAYEAIKKAVFFHGGVQSSLYTSITGSQSRSAFYKEETSSYCYQGDEIPNHDVVIVGWDDTYPKENFQMGPEGDGAFLCVSSWGESFGEEGYFYVSYYDSNIGGNSLVYTGIEPADNYDVIYQSDLCGWVGQVGYGSDTAFGANVYVAEDEELLKAAGFYAVGPDTSYEIFVVHHVEKEESLSDRKSVARGTVENSGFYTIPFDSPEELEPGERFALVIKAVTPEAVHPIAVEYQADDATAGADVTDGESYISLDGSRWEPMEERYQCNLCLKGYSDRERQDKTGNSSDRSARLPR